MNDNGEAADNENNQILQHYQIYYLFSNTFNDKVDERPIQLAMLGKLQPQIH